MRKLKLTPFAKNLLKVLIVIIACVCIFISFLKAGIFTQAKTQISSIFNKDDSSDEMYKKAGEIAKEDGTINISLDEWIG